MSTTTEPAAPSAPENREEFLSAMFASLVIQQTNMAGIFLGLAPNPQTGETGQDLEHAQYFIDQLEMLEAKTKGNLNRQEEGLLRQSLTNLRMAFVEVVAKAAVAAPPQEKAEAPPVATPAAPSIATAPAVDDSKKKFTKKY
jgi:hypothetical protein